MASSITSVQVAVITTDVPSLMYSINVNCTIHPDSNADMCEVMAVPVSGQTIIGNGNECIILLVLVCGSNNYRNTEIKNSMHMYIRIKHR